MSTVGGILKSRGARLTFLRGAMIIALPMCASLQSQSALPKNNLDYPVLIRHARGMGSGFFVGGDSFWYLVTAGHVIFADTAPYVLKAAEAEISGYQEGRRYVLQVNLKALERDGLVKEDPSHQIAVAVLGRVRPTYVVWYAPYLKRVDTGSAQITTTSRSALRTYSQALIGNDVYVFGYPRSIGLRAVPQIDYDRPLLHKGIVAGKNPEKKTIILDVPAYPGNSGGPVVEIEETEALNVQKFVENVQFLVE